MTSKDNNEVLNNNLKQKDESTRSHYLYNGNNVTPMAAANLVSSRTLAVGTYEVQFHPEKGFWLSKIEDMMVPPVIFGDTSDFSKRVIKTFLDRGCNTGVLLEGEQGSGKTMLAKLVSAALRELGLPTIVINNAYTGPAFNAFMAAIDTPCMVFFDEFEKTYFKQEDKEKILTFFDGVFDSNKLIICTVNDKTRMSTHMLNRPGRLFYSMSYNRLSLEVIEEYCNSTLVNKEMIPMIKQVTTLYGGFNFDMLKALVEEMNRFNCTPKEALKYLNIKPSYTKFRTGTVFIPVGMNESRGTGTLFERPTNPPNEDGGTSIQYQKIPESIKVAYDNLINGKTINNEDIASVIAFGIAAKADTDEYGYRSMNYTDRVYFSSDDLLAYDGDSGVQTYENDGAVLKFIPVKESELKEIAEIAKEKALVLRSQVNEEAEGPNGPKGQMKLPKLHSMS